MITMRKITAPLLVFAIILSLLVSCSKGTDVTVANANTSSDLTPTVAGTMSERQLRGGVYKHS